MKSFGRKEVKSDSANRTCWIYGFLFEISQDTDRSCRQLIVLLCLVEAFYVVDTKRGRMFFGKFCEVVKRFAEKVITGNDQKIVFVDIPGAKNKMDVTYRSTLIRVGGGTVVDDSEIGFVVRRSVGVGPR